MSKDFNVVEQCVNHAIEASKYKTILQSILTYCLTDNYPSHDIILRMIKDGGVTIDSYDDEDNQ